ncbi:hypothetical protein [Rugosibacter aromaticivorans]|uniref:hypothetical protein n=1 Tax=Rugosibacter aromaticivorans TaxID=1565605 RepID=UPI000B2A11D1|nr:hypothetical protein [Rugosibacter aromaticivorans]
MATLWPRWWRPYGVLHAKWPLALVGRQDADLLRRCWRHVLGEGNIDVQKPKHLRGEVSTYVLTRLHGRVGKVGFVGVDTHVMAGRVCSWGVIPMYPLPETGYLRLPLIIGNPKVNPPIPALIPVSKLTWWGQVRTLSSAGVNAKSAHYGVAG